MRPRFVLILLTLLLLTGVQVDALASSPAAGTYEIHGRVMDPSGAVIAGASVTLFSQGRTPVRTTETDASGEFRLVDVAPGSYELVARAMGMEPQSAAISVPQVSQKPLELRLSLSRVSTTVTVTPGRGEVSNTFDVAGQVNVVGSEALARRPAVILPQLLREEVGVTVQQTSAHQGAVIVRGLTGQQVLHLVDGVRLNNSTFRPGPNQYFALVDPNFVERIEVVRGPSSAQYGSDSLGGAVNVLPLRLYPEATDRRFHGELMPFFRSADLASGSRMRLSYGTDQWSVLGGLSGARVQDMRAGGGGDSHAAVTRFLGLPSDILGNRLQDTAFTKWAGFARFYWKPAATQHFTASYLRSEQRGGRRYDQLNGGNGNLLNRFDPQILDFLYLRYEKQPLGWLDSLSGTFSYNSQRDDRTEQGGSGNPLAGINDEFNDVDAFGYQVQATTHIGARQSVVFGGEIYDEYIDSTRIRINPVSGSREAVRPRFPDQSRYTTLGLFYQHGVEVIPGRLRLNGGLRYSAVNFRTFAEANLRDALGNPLVPDFSTTLPDLTFNVGASLRVTSTLDLFGTVRRGFRAPNATDFSSVGLSSNGFEISPQQGQDAGGEVGSTADATALSTGQGVGGLSPEVLYNYEMGLRVRGRRMTASLSGFVNDISDFITKRTLILPPGAVGQTIGGQTIVSQLPSGAVITGADSRPVIVRANVGAVRLWGVEAAWEGQVTDSFVATANFYYLRGRDQQSGLPPDIEGGLPPATGFASLRWQPLGKRYWVEAYSTLASYQDRLSSIELADQRIGALRSRASITNFFNNGAVARGLVSGGILLPTGETLAEVLERVLGVGVNSAPFFTRTPGYATANLRGGFSLTERSDIVWVVENLLDKNYRVHGSGVDGPGANLQVSYRIRF
ncbi:MAG: TonB-dependent receptor [Candidatus Acidiferrales bacterium]